MKEFLLMLVVQFAGGEPIKSVISPFADTGPGHYSKAFLLTEWQCNRFKEIRHKAIRNSRKAGELENLEFASLECLNIAPAAEQFIKEEYNILPRIDLEQVEENGA